MQQLHTPKARFSPHELIAMCYELLSESLPSCLSWPGIPSTHAMLFTEARENPLLTEVFLLKTEEKATQPGEVSV